MEQKLIEVDDGVCWSSYAVLDAAHHGHPVHLAASDIAAEGGQLRPAEL